MQTRSSQFMWRVPLQVFLFSCFLPAAMFLPAFVAADFSNEVMITAYDGVAGDDFGYSVSIDGDSLLIGAFDNNGVGSAYVYVRNPATDTWSLQKKFNGPLDAVTNKFGYSVSISGDTALIGAKESNDKGVRSGSAYVYVRDPATGAWSEQQKLLASDGTAGDLFGTAVSLSGNTAIVGASLNVSSYVFVRDTATGIWTEQQKLVATEVTAVGFGGAVFIEGDMAIVGASGEDTTVIDSGAAYIFVRDGTDTWNLEQKLLASDAGRGDALGVSVSLNGDTAIVGAPLDGLGWGSAYIFVRDFNTGTWTEQQKLLASDTGVGHFGRSVALNGDTAIVGADRAGAAYVYARDTNTDTWTENQKMRASVVAGGYGLSMSISGNALVIGAHDTAGKGAAFIYTSATGTTSPQTITNFAATPSSGLVSGSSTLSAGASSGLAVTFGSNTPIVCMVADSTVSYLIEGTCIVTADQAGDASFDPAPQVTLNIIVTKTDQTITDLVATPPTGVVAGTSVLSATASSGLTVSFGSSTPTICTVSGSTVTYLAVGTCTVTADQAGDDNFNPAPQVTLDIGVGLLDQAITNFVATPSPGVVNGTSALSATGGASGNPVVFGSNTPAVCTVAGSTVSYVMVGTCTVTADQAGDANYNAAPQVTLDITVAKADQAITGLAANPATGVVKGSSALSATASSGLTVSFGSSTPTVCTVTGATASYLAAGTCTVTADQAGDSAYNTATQATLNISVAKADQTITGLTADPASGVIGGTSVLSVTSAVSVASVARIAQSGQKQPTTKASGIPITFGSNTLSICTVAGSTVSYLAVGTCTVTADQAGDANYNPAPQLTLDINVTEALPVIPNVPIPTLSLWGLLVMFLVMLGIGGIFIRLKALA